MLVDELPDQEAGRSQHGARHEERPTDPDRLRNQATEHRPRGDTDAGLSWMKRMGLR